MAVSKRLRYEILRRDNHTCRYCGGSAPDVKLTVDHVLPRALGGLDEATNLVACCSDCNSGKTSTTPDAPLVGDVEDSALRWSAAMHAAIQKATGDHQAEIAYRTQFESSWNKWRLGKGTGALPLPLEENWKQSIDTFRTRGLPVEILTDAIDKAMGAKHVKPQNAFRYMCGIAWNRVAEIDATARALFDQQEPCDEPDEEDDPERSIFDAFDAQAVWPRLMRENELPTEHVATAYDYMRQFIEGTDGHLQHEPWASDGAAFDYLLWCVAVRDLFAIECFFLAAKRNTSAGVRA